MSKKRLTPLEVRQRRALSVRLFEVRSRINMLEAFLSVAAENNFDVDTVSVDAELCELELELEVLESQYWEREG